APDPADAFTAADDRGVEDLRGRVPHERHAVARALPLLKLESGASTAARPRVQRWLGAPRQPFATSSPSNRPWQSRKHPTSTTRSGTDHERSSDGDPPAGGIGANTAIFSLINDFLLRPLPVRDPRELVLLRNIDGAGGRMSRSGENNGSIDPVTGRAASTR